MEDGLFGDVDVYMPWLSLSIFCKALNLSEVLLPRFVPVSSIIGGGGGLEGMGGGVSSLADIVLSSLVTCT